MGNGSHWRSLSGEREQHDEVCILETPSFHQSSHVQDKLIQRDTGRIGVRAREKDKEIPESEWIFNWRTVFFLSISRNESWQAGWIQSLKKTKKNCISVPLSFKRLHVYVCVFDVREENANVSYLWAGNLRTIFIFFSMLPSISNVLYSNVFFL